MSKEYPTNTALAGPDRRRQGNSKALVVDKYQQDGHHVFYAGDGISDFEAAPRVDVLFAHRALAEKCASENIPFRLFTDFHDMLQAVREYQWDGHQPSSSRSGSRAAPENEFGRHEGNE